jgi:flagellar motility protein MotE (MotC chaperone)
MRSLMLIPILLAATAGGALADALSEKVDMIVTGALGPQNDAEKYCRNIADAAREAKFEWQVKTIAELEEALALRTRSLEEKRAEVEDWLAKRNAFMALAEDHLVGIYSKMRPEAASLQLAELGPVTASALLMKLQPRISSAILNEMPAEQAAGLAALMIEAGADKRRKAAGQEAGKEAGKETGNAEQGDAAP